MPVTKSAKKAMRSSQVKRQYNVARKLKIRNSLKELRQCLATNPQEYQETLNKAYSALDKAVKTNYIHKGRADRKKSRLAKMVAKALETKETEKQA